MSNDTKARIKQILNDCCAGNASLATDILIGEFVIIDRTETDHDEPTEETVDGLVLAGSGPEFAEASVHHSPNWIRNRARNYLRIADYLENRDAILAAREAEATAARDKRRDELARELVEDGAYAYRFAEEPLKLAIDRIIDLESAA
jgi:hypothetical protein